MKPTYRKVYDPQKKRFENLEVMGRPSDKWLKFIKFLYADMLGPKWKEIINAKR